jgi:hypothetical protein
LKATSSAAGSLGIWVNSLLEISELLQPQTEEILAIIEA